MWRVILPPFIVLAVVFGAWEPRTGAVGSLWDVLRDRRLNHRPEVLSGPTELPRISGQGASGRSKALA